MTFRGCGNTHEDLNAMLLEFLLNFHNIITNQITLVQKDQLTLLFQGGGVRMQFFANGFVVINKLLNIDDIVFLQCTTEIKQMQENTAALDVLQEFITESFSFACSFNQSRNIADHIGAIADSHHSQVWDKRRKRIRSNLRTCTTDHGNQRRLSHAWVSDDPDIRDKFKLEFQVRMLSWFAKFSKIRTLTCGTQEVRIAKTSATAVRNNHLITGLPQVCEQLRIIGIFRIQFHHTRSGRYSQNFVISSTTGTIASASEVTLFRFKLFA